MYFQFDDSENIWIRITSLRLVSGWQHYSLQYGSHPGYSAVTISNSFLAGSTAYPASNLRWSCCDTPRHPLFVPPST